jgi:alginate O-acetyltransferase complex protein AlgI
VFMLIEWVGREGRYAVERIGLGWGRPLRWGFYYVLLLFILGSSGADQQFIYFQF